MEFLGGPWLRLHPAHGGSALQSLKPAGIEVPVCLVAQPKDVKRKNTLVKQGIRKEGWATEGFPGHSGAAMGSANSDFSRSCLRINLGIDLASISTNITQFPGSRTNGSADTTPASAAYISWFVEREDTWAADNHFGPFHLLLPISFLLWIGFVLQEKKKLGDWLLAVPSSLRPWSCAHLPSPASVGKTQHLNKRAGRPVGISALQRKWWGSSPAPPQQDSGLFPHDWASDNWAVVIKGKTTLECGQDRSPNSLKWTSSLQIPSNAHALQPSNATFRTLSKGNDQTLSNIYAPKLQIRPKVPKQGPGNKIMENPSNVQWSSHCI